MIYSVTLNPSIDYVVSLPNLALGAVNHLHTAVKLPGGKGINVSRILHTLDLPTTAWGFTGGMPGEFITERLATIGLTTAFTPIAADSRINVKLKAAEETELNAPGPAITDAEVAAFRANFDALKPGDVVVMAGSLPASLPERFYRDLIPLIQARGADFVIDTTGEALLATLPAHPLVVKPNHHELAALFGDAEYPDLTSIVTAGRKLLTLGAQHVLVSMAGAGALMITASQAWHGQVTPGTVKNSVGAGDSMLAGFTGTFARTHDALTSFKQAIACGSATAFCVDLADRATIDAVAATVTVTEL